MTDFNFQGSEKQITWASQIREEAHEKMQKEIKDADDRVNVYKNMPNYWSWCVRDAVEFISKFIDIKIGNNAAKWIERRNHVGGYANDVHARAAKRYEFLREKYQFTEITEDQYQEGMNEFKKANKAAKNTGE